MDMSATAMATGSTTMAAMTTSAPSSSEMGGMDMGMGGACKISMLWNWYTIDSCFLSSTWHVRSSGAFAGSCIGVIFLVISLELLRRAQREWDRYLRRSQRLKNTSSILQDNNSGSDDNEHDQHCANKNGSSRSIQRPHTRGIPNVEPRLEVWQQVVRSLLYMLQFAVGYFVMLLAMYYNGYIIIMIFVGAFLGALIFQWDTFEPVGTGQVHPESQICC